MNCRLTTTVLIALSALSGCLQELPDGSNLVGLANEPGSPSASSPTSSTSNLFFRPDVQQDLEVLGCAVDACHGSGTLPMELIETPQADIEWASNYEQVVARCVGSVPSLLGKALGDDGHLQALDPDDPVVTRWEAWIAAGMPFEASSTGAGGQNPGPNPGTGGGEPVEGLSWTQDIGPLLAGLGCVTCHGPQDVQAGYSLSSYDGALGMGSDDFPNVIPGQAESLLIVRVTQGHGDIAYEDALQVLTWVVDWQAQE